MSIRAVALASLVSTACATARGRLEPDVVFTRYSALSTSGEIARRALPPIANHRMQQDLTARGQRLADQAIDLAKEKFDIYAPSDPPPAAGYGLVVYIAPWSKPTRPREWRSALDAHHLVFVAAQATGNGQSVLDRRVPLALLAHENARARFPIDPARVYIMGFSGGARVAELVALAYPDIFRGAILNAGSDPIDGSHDGEGNFKPPIDLFRAFQRSRLVYITGEGDPENLRRDEVSRESMRASCVLDLREVLAPRLAHHALDGFALDRALDALEQSSRSDPGELAACNARRAATIAAALASVAATLARGDRTAALAQLLAFDAQFGGEAAPMSIELYDRMMAP